MAINLDHIYEEIQTRLSKRTILIVGTGASIALDWQFGMAALEKRLNKTIPPLIKTPLEQKEWDAVLEARKANKDFESSLSAVTSTELLSNIITETGKHVINISRKHYTDLHTGSLQLPLYPLLNKLKQALPPSYPILDIITPNYDLLVEYTLAAIGLPYTDGFIGGIKKKLNWNESYQQFYRIKQEIIKGKRQLSYSLSPYARLFKVHGSLNHYYQNKELIRNDAISFQSNDQRRAIITPGDGKYQHIVENMMEPYNHAIQAIEEAQTFLFAGYGFNDTDIDKRITDLAGKSNYEVVIVTRDLLGKSMDLIANNPGAIAICRGENDDYSIIRHQKQELEVQTNIWAIDRFATEILY